MRITLNRWNINGVVCSSIIHVRLIAMILAVVHHIRQGSTPGKSTDV